MESPKDSITSFISTYVDLRSQSPGWSTNASIDRIPITEARKAAVEFTRWSFSRGPIVDS